MSTYVVTCPPMQPVSDWYLYLAPSIGIFFGGLFLLIVYNVFYNLCRADRKKRTNEPRTGWMADFLNSPKKEWLDNCINGTNAPGRALLLLIFCLSMTSFILFLMDASLTASGVSIEYCINWFNAPLIQADFALNMIFLCYFFFRMLASAHNLLAFWLSWQTIVDMATIPTCFTYYGYNRYWSALRFFRVMYLMLLPELAEKAGLLKNATHIRLATLGSQFMSLWFMAAGFVHLLENSGDPWLSYFNGQTLGYWSCMYFMIVTGSTVGYGDISCKTVLGQIFDCFYIFVGLAMFATALPEVLNIMQIASPYKGRFRIPDGKRFVVVCGHVVAESASKFVDTFLHPDWDVNDLVIVFINPAMPSIDFEGLLKRYQNKLFYISGSEMSGSDLDRVCFSEADATIILADPFADDPDDEDSANIMRAIAMKNLCGDMRILIQLLLEQNKPNLRNVPNWGPADEVVCLDEVKMSMLALNCWAPGFATLLSLMMTQMESTGEEDEESLESAYMNGVGMEVYCQELPPYFAGLTFPEVVKHCYKSSNILMFAVTSDGIKPIICPSRTLVIKNGDSGYFIANAADSVEKALYFCKHCDRDIRDQPDGKCNCRKNKEPKGNLLTSNKIVSISERDIESGVKTTVTLSAKSPQKSDVSQQNRSDEQSLPRVQVAAPTTSSASEVQKPPQSNPEVAQTDPHPSDEAHTQHHLTTEGLGGVVLVAKKKHGREIMKQPVTFTERFDKTGMFYWCEPRAFEEAELSLENAKSMNFKNHVILCLFGEPGSPRLGLRNFIMPLRASNREVSELMPIVIIGYMAYTATEWHNIKVFPGIYVINESPMNRNALRACNIDKSRMCVIVSARKKEIDPILMDRHAILSYLNIKAMNFDDDQQQDAGEQPLVRPRTGVPGSETARNKAQSAAPIIANTISIIADVFVPENVLVLDDDVTHNTDTPLQVMNPFACGNVFAGDILTNTTCISYYSRATYKLVRELLSGGSTTETENLFAEGLGLMEGKNRDLETIKQGRCRAQISEFFIADEAYREFLGIGATFSSLFLGILLKYGYVCMGIARLRDVSTATTSAARAYDRRVVLLCPPENYRLHPTDVVLCLKPFTPA